MTIHLFARPSAEPRRSLPSPLIAFRSLLALLVGGSLLASAADAGAQPQRPISGARVAEDNGEGMDLHLYRPPVDSKGFLAVNGADIVGANDVSLGLVIDYGHDQMKLNKDHGDDVLLKHAFQGTFQFNYGIANILTVGMSAPVILNQGDRVADIGPTGETYTDDEGLDAQGLGHIALHAKLRVFRPDGDAPVGVAVIVQGGPSVSNTRDFGSEPGFFYWPQVVVEKRFGATGALKLGLNGGFRGHTGANPQFGLATDPATGQPSTEPQLDSGEFEYSNLLTGGFGINYRVLAALDLGAETYMTYQLGGGSDSDQKLSAETIGGLKLFIERNSFLMLGGGIGYTPGFQAAAQRFILGFIFEPSIGDRDGDGIKDDEDDCPDDPEDFDGFQDTRTDSPPNKYGCPDPDNDNDGILDKDDRCPNNPEDRDGDEDEDGCPEGSDGDRDGDGILDSRDKCPDVPEDRDGFEDKDGCPELDNDKDGIPDTKDQCPNDPEDRDNFEDENGCPDPDNDRDGIPDVRDKCPMDPETYNGTEDEDGCPDKGKVIIQGSDILILEKIQFKTASAEILPESFGIVEAVATTLTHHPEFLMIEVQGHADERATDEYNLKLTQDRANAVVEAMAKKGVARKRMRAQGYGEYCPLDPASNAAAWEKNRRVEFKVVRSDTGPTGVELGCEKARSKGVNPAPP